MFLYKNFLTRYYLFVLYFSLSVVDLQAYLNKHNIDQTPASVSPLIRIIIRLWCHETCRSFYDRIINTEDKKWFATTLQKTVVVKFCGEKPSLVNKQGILSRGTSMLLKVMFLIYFLHIIHRKYRVTKKIEPRNILYRLN